MIIFHAISNNVRTGYKRITLDSDIQIGAVCCLSINSMSLLYQLSAVKSSDAVKMWLQNFSNFWHCSSSFFEDKWAFLQMNKLIPALEVAECGTKY